ncbi:MAG: response regulator [Chloroflexota bacterium]
MNIPLVIIESRIGFAISIKQALEQTGQFRVVPMADAFAALDYIAQNPVRVVVVALNMPEYPGVALIQAIRQKQPDAFIYASTSDSQVAIQATTLNIAGLLDSNYAARQLLDTLNRALPELMTASEIPVEPPSRVQLPQLPDDNMPTDALFQRLVDEEPPRPDAKHGGTITNFMRRVSDAELSNLLNSLSDVIDIPDEPVNSNDDSGDDPDMTESDTPAQYILEDITEETMPFEATPFETYLKQLRSTFENHVDPEPDFLEGKTFDGQDDQLIQTTQSSAPELERIEQNQQDPETVTIHGQPLPDEPETPDADLADEITVPEIPGESDAEPEAAPPEDSPQATQSVPPVDGDIWDWGDDDVEAVPEDPRIAQMALRLTRTSLESTAIATLLIEDSEIIASDGDLADTDVEAVTGIVLGSVDTIKDNSGQVRFIELPVGGQDALIYSRHTTDEDYIISMIFPGDTTMTDMRVQARRLAEALDAVPAIPPEDIADLQVSEAGADDVQSRGGLRLEVTAPVDVGPLVRYTFVWLPRDPKFQIEHAVAEAINSGLRIQLGERGWAIEELDVEEDYVYLVAGIPGEEPPQSIARNLQKRSAKIASIQRDDLNPESLWADSYFALAPGRKLEYQEIQGYIQFCRM